MCDDVVYVDEIQDLSPSLVECETPPIQLTRSQPDRPAYHRLVELPVKSDLKKVCVSDDFIAKFNAAFQ